MVVINLTAESEPWTADVRVVRVADATSVADVSSSFEFAKFADALVPLGRRVVEALTTHTAIRAQPGPTAYRVPDAVDFPNYLLRIEQLLAVRTAGMEGAGEHFLSGEREIIEGNIHQCVANPKNVTTRLLLARTVASMRKIRPQIVDEFEKKLEKLQAEHPLPEPAQRIVGRILRGE